MSFFFFVGNYFCLHVLQEAQSSKAPIQAFADRMSSIFAPVVLSLASISFFSWCVQHRARPVRQTPCREHRTVRRIPYSTVIAVQYEQFCLAVRRTLHTITRPAQCHMRCKEPLNACSLYRTTLTSSNADTKAALKVSSTSKHRDRSNSKSVGVLG